MEKMTPEQRAANLPDELKEKPIWLKTGRDSKGDYKKPVGRGGAAGKGAAGWTRAQNWFSFDEVKEYPQNISVCVVDGLACLDFDNVIDKNGQMHPKAYRLLSFVMAHYGATYLEFSNSGRGLHMFYHIDALPDFYEHGGDFKIFFDKKRGAKCEIFAGRSKDTARKAIALTGRLFNEKIPRKIAPPRPGNGGQAEGRGLLEYLAPMTDKWKKEQRRQQEAAARARRPSPPMNDGEGAKNHESILRALEYIPCSDLSYSEWVNVGAALHQEGFDASAWEEWSAADADRYKPGECARKWKSFHTGGGITGATIYEIAKRYGYVPKEPRPAARASTNRKKAARRTSKATGKEPIVVRQAKELPPPVPDRQNGKAAAGGIEWPDVNERGKPIALTEANAAALLEAIGVRVRVNEMSKDLDFSGRCLEGIPHDGSRTKNSITRIRSEGARLGVNTTYDNWLDMIELIAARYKFNPARDFLQKAQREFDPTTDTADYIGQAFSCFELDPDDGQDADLCYSEFLHFFVGAARAPFNTFQKCESYQGILILVGPQHIGKTRWLEKVIPFPEMRESGKSLNPSNRDNLWLIIRHWGVELGEFENTMKKTKVESMKNFVTSSRDTFRKPYGRGFSEYPRQSFFYGSTNSVRFLRDDTGDRRYWPIVIKRLHLEKWPDPLKFWGQVMALAFDPNDKTYTKMGAVSWWLEDDELDRLTRMQEAHKVETEEEAALHDILDWKAPLAEWLEKTSTQVANILMNCRKGRDLSPVKIGKVLQRMAMSDNRIRYKTAHSGRLYRVPPVRKGLDAFQNEAEDIFNMGG